MIAATAAAGENRSEGPLSTSELPLDFLRHVVQLLDVRDLCSISCSCRSWRSVALEAWASKVHARWKHWSSTLPSMSSPEAWQKIYAERHKIDVHAASQLENMPWPWRQEGCLSMFKGWGLDSLDFLTAAATANGPLTEGKNYWAWAVLTQLQTAWGCQRLKEHVAASSSSSSSSSSSGSSNNGTVGNNSNSNGSSMSKESSLVELGALCIVQVHYPITDLGAVSQKLDMLAEELQRRLAAAGISNGRQALEILNQLLFGDPPPGFTAPEQGSLSHLDNDEFSIPPPEYGLGLKGNSEDYENPCNSLLNDVLRYRLGIPITLAVVHMAVAQRVGLPVQLLNMPMHVINYMAGPPGRESADELFIDVFDKGRIMDWEQLRDFTMTIGFIIPRARLQPMTPQAICQRMCANLISIYNNVRDYEKLKIMLDLVTAVDPQSKDYLQQRSRIAVLVRDFHDATVALQELQELLLREAGSDAVKHSFLEVQMSQVQERVEEVRADYMRSSQTRKVQAPSVKFSVGDVIRHKRYHYRGVIYDWDATCTAEEQWIQQMGVDALPGGRQQPFYRVLVDARDRPFQNTYVAQCNVTLLAATSAEGARVEHSEIGAYFEGLDPDTRRYVPNGYMQYRFSSEEEESIMDYYGLY